MISRQETGTVGRRVIFCLDIPQKNMSEQSLNIKFVQEVEKFPCLYNYKLSQYSRKDITEAAWNKIGKEMNMTGKYMLY